MPLWVTQKRISKYLADHPVNAIALVIPAHETGKTEELESMLRALDALFGEGVLRDHLMVFVTGSSIPSVHVEPNIKMHITDVRKRLFYFDNRCVVPAQLASLIDDDEFDGEQLWNFHRAYFNRVLHALKPLKPIESLKLIERKPLIAEMKY